MIIINIIEIPKISKNQKLQFYYKYIIHKIHYTQNIPYKC